MNDAPLRKVNAISSCADLSASIILRRSSIFPNPGNDTDILQVVYGNHTEALNAGSVKTIEIDFDNIFLISDSPIKEVLEVYDSNGKTVDPDAYCVNVDGSFANINHISYINFRFRPSKAVPSLPYSKPFTVRCIGKVDSDGVPITAPSAIISDFLYVYGGWNFSNFDSTLLSDSLERCIRNRYNIKWIFDSDISCSDIILNLMYNVMGNSFFIDGKMGLQVPPPVDKINQSSIIGHVVANRDCEQGESDPSYVVDEQNLITEVDIKFNYDWANGNFIGYVQVKDPYTNRVYGHSHTIAIELKGIQAESTARSIGQFILNANSIERGLYTFTVKKFLVAGAKFGDLLGFSWNFGPGLPGIKNELLRIMDIQEDFDKESQTITARETFAFMVQDHDADGWKRANGNIYADVSRDTNIYR